MIKKLIAITACASVLATAGLAFAADTNQTGNIAKLKLEDADSDSSPRLRVYLSTGDPCSKANSAYLDLDNDAARVAYNLLLAAYLGGKTVTLLSHENSNSCRLMDITVNN